MGLDTAFHYFSSIFELLIIDLLLSGDNAIVIALACRSLGAEQKRKAMLAGTGGAILLRVLMTTIAGFVIQLPLLKLIGGVMLVVIAIKLLVDTDDGEQGRDADARAISDFWSAVSTVIVADVVMSLDNVMALAAVAQGNVWLLMLGLLISIPLLMFGSLYVITLLERYPLLVKAGGAMLGWIAGDIAISDALISDWVNQQSPALNVVIPLLVAIFVIVESKIIEKNRPLLIAMREHMRRQRIVTIASPFEVPITVNQPLIAAVLATPPQALQEPVALEVDRSAIKVDPLDATNSPLLEGSAGAVVPNLLASRRFVVLKRALIIFGLFVGVVLAVVQLFNHQWMPNPGGLNKYDCAATQTTLSFRHGLSNIKLTSAKGSASATIRLDKQIDWGDLQVATQTLGIVPPTHLKSEDARSVVIDGGAFAMSVCTLHVGDKQ